MFNTKQIQLLRRLIKKSDPRINTVIPVEMKQALEAAAKANGRTLGDEVRARLAVTFEHQNVMVTDRLMRLIYCEKLAYQGK